MFYLSGFSKGHPLDRLLSPSFHFEFSAVVWKRSQRRPNCSLNRSNCCAVGTYWFFKRHFGGWRFAQFLFLSVFLCTFCLLLFINYFVIHNTIVKRRAVEPIFEKIVPHFKTCIFIVLFCAFAFSFTFSNCNCFFFFLFFKTTPGDRF